MLLLTLTVETLTVLYGLATERGGALHRTQWDMRFVAYPLWTVGTVLLLNTVARGIRMMRHVGGSQPAGGHP